MGSNPIIGTPLKYDFTRGIGHVAREWGCERSRTETHKTTVNLSTIRQVTKSRLYTVWSKTASLTRHAPIIGRHQRLKKDQRVLRKVMALSVGACISLSEILTNL